MQAFELGSPVEAIGKILKSKKQAEVAVVGVVKNFNFRTLENRIGPIVLYYQPA